MEWDFIRDETDLYLYVTDRLRDCPGKPYLFIDEVQEIANWEHVINSLLADNRADITVTGSNADLLSSELVTLIAGRYIEFPVFPYLNALYSTVVLKDVVSRNRIRDPAQLDRIVRFVFDNAGNITTAKRIADFLKNQKTTAGVDKVLHYLACLEQAFLIRRGLRYDIKGLRHLELYEKYYVGDIGLRHGFLGYQDNDVGGVLENIIYLEPLHRGCHVSIGKLGDREIDFIAERHEDRIYIQVCLTLESSETIEREFSVLERVPDNHPKLVLSLDEYQRVSRGGVRHENLRKWLLKEWAPGSR